LGLFRSSLIWVAVGAAHLRGFVACHVVDPIGTLTANFHRRGSYASEGHDSITFFNGQSTRLGYPIGASTQSATSGEQPQSSSLVSCSCFWLQRCRAGSISPRAAPDRSNTCGLFAVLFTIFMTTGAKKFDRYLLPIFAPWICWQVWGGLLRSVRCSSSRPDSPAADGSRG